MPRCRPGLIVILLGLGLGVATASAQQPNLLVNGGAESDVGGNGFTNVPPSGWQLTGAPTVTKHGSFSADFFGTSDPGPAVRGLNYITGGNGQAVSTLSQTAGHQRGRPAVSSMMRKTSSGVPWTRQRVVKR